MRRRGDPSGFRFIVCCLFHEKDVHTRLMGAGCGQRMRGFMAGFMVNKAGGSRVTTRLCHGRLPAAGAAQTSVLFYCAGLQSDVCWFGVIFIGLFLLGYSSSSSSFSSSSSSSSSSPPSCSLLLFVFLVVAIPLFLLHLLLMQFSSSAQ